MNRSEEFVYRICKKSFLSLWSYANPRGKKTKELCDILVVCEPDIIIFSVKEIKLSSSGDESVDWERWQKQAIEKSAQQIYGAERWISHAASVIRKDGNQGIQFPPPEKRRIHRIAVALGSEGKVSLKFGDFGKGFVHVFDEISFQVILQELDTISDFVSYLLDKEDLFKTGPIPLFNGSEEDLLALYLYNNRSFPKDYHLILWRREFGFI